MNPTDSASATPQPKVERVFDRNTIAWASGGFAEALMQAAIATFFMPIFTTGFGISPFWVSLAITVPRLIDAFTDPFIGYFSDNTKTRWGRRRPFIFVSCIVVALMNAIIWWLPSGWSLAAQVTWLIVLSTLFWQAWAFYTIPRMALGYELTDDYHGRTRVMATNMFFAITPGLFIGWIYWLALRPAFGGEIHGIRIVSMILGVLIIGIGILPAIFCRERFATANKNHLGFFRSVGQAFQNKPFVYIVAIRVVQAVGTAIWGGFNFYVNLAYVCQGDKDLTTKLQGIGTTMWTVIAFVMVPLTPRLGRAIGKHKGMMIGLGGLAFVACLQPILTTPNHPYWVLIAAVLTGPAQICANLFIASFMPDVCDLDELKSGLRREGLYSAVDKFVAKIEVSILVLVTGGLLTLVGFDQNAHQQTPEVIHRMLWVYFGPLIICSLTTVVLAWKFPINHKMMLEVRRQLDERRAAQATAAHPPVV